MKVLVLFLVIMLSALTFGLITKQWPGLGGYAVAVANSIVLGFGAGAIGELFE